MQLCCVPSTSYLYCLCGLVVVLDSVCQWLVGKEQSLLQMQRWVWPWPWSGRHDKEISEKTDFADTAWQKKRKSYEFKEVGVLATGLLTQGKGWPSYPSHVAVTWDKLITNPRMMAGRDCDICTGNHLHDYRIIQSIHASTTCNCVTWSIAQGFENAWIISRNSLGKAPRNTSRPLSAQSITDQQGRWPDVGSIYLLFVSEVGFKRPQMHYYYY